MLECQNWTSISGYHHNKQYLQKKTIQTKKEYKQKQRFYRQKRWKMRKNAKKVYNFFSSFVSYFDFNIFFLSLYFFLCPLGYKVLLWRFRALCEMTLQMRGENIAQPKKSHLNLLAKKLNGNSNRFVHL